MKNVQPFVLQSFSMLVDNFSKRDNINLHNKSNSDQNYNSEVRNNILEPPNGGNSMRICENNEKSQIKKTLTNIDRKCRNNIELTRASQFDLSKSDTQFSYKNTQINSSYHLIEDKSGQNEIKLIRNSDSIKSNLKSYLSFGKYCGREQGFELPISNNSMAFHKRIRSTDNGCDLQKPIQFNPKYKSNIQSYKINNKIKRDTSEHFEKELYCGKDYDNTSKDRLLRNLGRVVNFSGYSNRGSVGSIYKHDKVPEIFDYQSVANGFEKTCKFNNNAISPNYEKQACDRKIQSRQRIRKIRQIFQIIQGRINNSLVKIDSSKYLSQSMK